MFHLYKYKTPDKYLSDFKKTYACRNIRSVKTLSTVLLSLSSLARLGSMFFYEALTKLANYTEFSISNLTQITGSSIFLIISSTAIRKGNWSVYKMNVLTMVFCFYLLTTTFGVSYIVSLHNTKNTLAVFLIGIMFVGIFFALDLKKITYLSVFVVVLFLVSMITPGLSVQEKFLSVVTSIILALVLYTCGRYSYFFKSEHFIQVEQLQEKNKEINLLNQQKGEILSFVAHDLRAPLNNIESLSAIIIAEQKENPSMAAKMIANAAVHAKHIINDLIEVVREEKAPLETERTNLVPYLQGICAKWMSDGENSRKIEFVCLGKPVFASINTSKFTRVIDNLIGNALKFSPLNCPVTISLLADPMKCEIKIIDCGIGIPETLQQMLFDQFSKAGRPGLRGEKSIGLGLHISKNIIEEHGGMLHFESIENEGTTFTITLKAA